MVSEATSPRCLSRSTTQDSCTIWIRSFRSKLRSVAIEIKAKYQTLLVLPLMTMTNQWLPIACSIGEVVDRAAIWETTAQISKWSGKKVMHSHNLEMTAACFSRAPSSSKSRAECLVRVTIPYRIQQLSKVHWWSQCKVEVRSGSNLTCRKPVEMFLSPSMQVVTLKYTVKD